MVNNTLGVNNMNTMKVEIEVPDWVNWMAVDENGNVYGYSCKPKIYIEDGYWHCMKGTSERLYNGKSPKNWKEELYQWI